MEIYRHIGDDNKDSLSCGQTCIYQHMPKDMGIKSHSGKAPSMLKSS